MTEPTRAAEWNSDGLALCACHGHIDGLTLDEMAALGAPCPTASHFAAEIAAAEKRGAVKALRAFADEWDEWYEWSVDGSLDVRGIVYRARIEADQIEKGEGL